ncbi:MAG: hypothetical protein ABJA76_02905 [Mucilaginibacter sp.]
MTLVARIDYSNTYTSGSQTNGQVFITLFDADTGQPANGNNVTVSYTQKINGTIINSQAIIAGQSISIYTGLIRDDNPASLFTTTFTITNIGAESDPQPPVNACDLAVNFITVDKQESAPGASDAQITINATSSYVPVLYSLDNDIFQASPTFSGLSGGVKTVYVNDANGCTAQSNITVPVQNSLLVSGPEVTLPGGNISRWNAAFNPIVFTYQRKDFEVTGVMLDTATGNALVSVSCDNTLINAALDANKKAKANAALLNIVLTNYNAVYAYINTNVYKGVYEIMDASLTGKLLLNVPFTANAVGFININLLRPYYQIRTQITYMDALTGQTNTITSTNRPDNTGLIKADLSNFLQSLLRAKDSSNFTQINYRDSNLSASYQLAYAGYWDGKLITGQALTYNTIADTYYVVYAAKQLGERCGGNMASYVPFRSVLSDSQRAKWVTDFAEPAYSNGYPFDIGFIYSDDLLGLPLYCELIPLDINRNPLPGGQQSTALLNEDGNWLLNQDGGKLIIADAGASNFPVPAQLGLNRLRISNSFGAGVYYFNLALKYDDEHSTHTVTQTQTVRVDDAVDEQSVYLRWIGLSGSWNYFRFVFNQEISLDVQNAVIIKNYVSDWENQDSIEEVISKSAGQKVKVMAEDLSVADIKGLQSIKYSPKVQMLVNKNPVKWQTIVINTATYSEYETQNGQAPFSVTFNLPSINIQGQ